MAMLCMKRNHCSCRNAAIASTFVKRIRKMGRQAGLHRDISGKRALRGRISIMDVLRVLEEAKGERWESF